MGGPEKTTDFFRLFMVPGMGHCGGGPGPNTFDAVSALDKWVAHGSAPEKIVASHVDQRQCGSHAAAMSLSAGGALERLGQHRRGGELHLRESGTAGVSRRLIPV